MKRTKIRTDKPFKERFFKKIEEIKKTKDDCWVWKWTKTSQNYACVRTKEKNYLAHRVSYFYFNGKLDKSLVVDHICSNRLCVNPNHLQQVTVSNNIKLEYQRFPNKKQGYNPFNTTQLPRRLIIGFCIHRHPIKSYDDMILSGKSWKCKACINKYKSDPVLFEKKRLYYKDWCLKNRDKILLYQKRTSCKRKVCYT